MKKTHGVTAYANSECRCRVCRRAWADYMKARRASARPPRPQPLFEDKKPRRKKLSDLAERLLETAARRTGKDENDVLEQAVRCCVPGLRFDNTTSA